MSFEQNTISSDVDRKRKSDSAGVLVLPPLLTVGTLLFGFAFHLVWPLRLGAPIWVRIGGAFLVVCSVGLAVWGGKTMRRAGTNVNPYKPSLTVVTDGPFRFTRNPLYLGNVVFYLGLTGIVSSVWPLILLAPMVAVFDWGIIQREERYLESKFGEAYRAYKSRVRRWL